jgi:hypothetical protein
MHALQLQLELRSTMQWKRLRRQLVVLDALDSRLVLGFEFELGQQLEQIGERQALLNN